MTAYMDHKNLANEVIDDARATEIADGVHRVLDRIAAAEAASGRDAGSVRLLAATKTRDVGEIMAAIDAGVRMIGENRPQEVVAKAEDEALRGTWFRFGGGRCERRCRWGFRCWCRWGLGCCRY